MKTSKNTLLKKIEQGYRENYCNGEYTLNLVTENKESTYVLKYTYETENNDIKGHIYVDIDSVKVAPLPEQQTGEESITDTIISDDNCSYNSEVLRAKQVLNTKYGNSYRKHLHAIMNSNWHHVSLATLANIDFDMLDEKRKLVFDINQILKDGIRNLYKCENHISFEVLERYVIRKCDELIRHNRLKAFWFSYIARQLDEVRRNTIYLYTPYITAHRNRW